jgi:hypothetical protein
LDQLGAKKQQKTPEMEPTDLHRRPCFQKLQNHQSRNAQDLHMKTKRKCYVSYFELLLIQSTLWQQDRPSRTIPE